MELGLSLKDKKELSEELKLKLRKKLVNLFHHPCSPVEDKEKIKKIIEKLLIL